MATAGFSVSSDFGAIEDPPGTAVDPTILFDASGANFGFNLGGNGGRNYLRTIQSDYATTSFVAEITITPFDMDIQDVYFGLGAGDAVPTQFRTPDWTTSTSSVMYYGETERFGDVENPPDLDIFRTQDKVELDVYTPIPTLTPDGTHRLRITFDRFARTFSLGFDVNFTGAFAADVTTPPMDVSSLYGATGWATEPSKIYFGGDDGMIVKDFQVTVSGPAVKDGDFNQDNAINAADWVIFRTNQQANLSALTLQQAFFLGDLNSDKKNNYADFNIFKQLYDVANGAGAFTAMVASVPEPTGLAMAGVATTLLISCRRHSGSRTTRR
ncbi:MAG: hypothetical protein C0485_02710 [Pirellula sp.]|nr:hypothetical protein [Pirellula sp.]